MPKKAPSFSCFSGVSGGYLARLCELPFTRYLGRFENIDVMNIRYVSNNVPANTGRVALEPIGNQNLVLVLIVAVSQDISTLESLFKIAKDVVDDDNSPRRIRRTSDVCFDSKKNKKN